MKKCKQALNDNTCDKDCCCYYCEDFETCGHACSNFDDKEELEQQAPDEKERLKAAELLGRRYGLFKENVNLEVEPVVLVNDLKE